MKIRINKVELMRALSLTQVYPEKKTTIPILNNTLIEVNKGILKICGSSMDLTSLVSTREVIVEKEGSTTVPGKLFYDLIKELPQECDILLSLSEGERLDIIAGGIQAKVIGQSAQEYPKIKAMELTGSTVAPAKDILSALEKTIYAVSLDEGRFVLNGVFFNAIAKGCRLAATDGFRLATSTRDSIDISALGDFILPRRACHELIAFLKDIVNRKEDAKITLARDASFVKISFEDMSLAAQLVDGEYPAYERSIPTTGGQRAVVNPNNLIAAVRRMILLVLDREKWIQITLSQGNMNLKTFSAQIGEGNEDLPLEYDGPEIVSAFNGRLFLEGIQSFSNAPFIELEAFSDENDPMIIRAVGDESSAAYVMPTRL